MTSLRAVAGLRRRVDQLDPPPTGCPNCKVELVDLRACGEAPDPPPCLNPAGCPGGVRQVAAGPSASGGPADAE